MNFAGVTSMTWIWHVLVFQSNAADVFHCFLFTRHYHHDTNREQASTSHSIPPEISFVPPIKQRVGPHSEFGGVSWSLMWPQLRFSPPFPAGGRLRRPWGVPFQFSFQLCKRKAALGCPFFTVVFQGETAFPVEETAFLVEDPGPYLLFPAAQIRTDLWKRSQTLEWWAEKCMREPQWPWKGLKALTLMPAAACPQCWSRTSPGCGIPLLDCLNSTRGALQSQVTVFVRKKFCKQNLPTSHPNSF